MWHLHWRADAARRTRPAESAGDGRVGTETRTGRRGSFQYVWHDTPAALQASDVPESVRVRGR